MASHSHPKIRILLVDFLDSYTFNIPSFVRKAVNDPDRFVVDVQPYTSLNKNHVATVVNEYDGVILSPGPGTVECTDDLGDFVPALFAHRPAVPIFGICLGFQALCQAFGASIKRLSMPHHGLISDLIAPDGSSLGRRATRYHSLEVCRDDKMLEAHVEIQALARNFSDDASQSIMEVKHRQLPFWGVQYHPESVYSVNCEVVIQPFLNTILQRSEARNLRIPSHPPSHLLPVPAHTVPSPSALGDKSNSQETVSRGGSSPSVREILWKKHQAQFELSDLLESDHNLASQFVLLDSSTKADWSLLSNASTAYVFRYSLRKQSYTFEPMAAEADGKATEAKSASLDDMWNFVQDISTRDEYIDGPQEAPFWGGFVGYISYELGLAELGLDPYPSYFGPVPDFDEVQLIWSSETLLYHKPTRSVYLVSLSRDRSWIENTWSMMDAQMSADFKTKPAEVGLCNIVHPKDYEYIDSIKAAQEEIKAGNSYELCLTALSDMHYSSTLPSSEAATRKPHGSKAVDQTSANLFAALRNTNPAAFMSWMSLGGLTFLSASPEEFLSFDADTRTAKMKPIKGTLAKKDAQGRPVTLEQAEKELHTPKVIAENLMIVDLVRNDLSKVSSNVTCPNLLWVEEIPIMYQLVSTVEAVVNPGVTAWDLLRCSLPPGSMTGAPKRRSCQILQTLERKFRGLYSGIVGYVDVRGHCQTSVSIRNACRYPGDTEFRVGAGGAITCLSDPQDEWDERQLKAASVCRSFTQRFEVLETALWDPAEGGLTHLDAHCRRLEASRRFFNFKAPVFCTGKSSSDPFAAQLARWVADQLDSTSKSQRLRLSIKLDSAGSLRMEVLPLVETPAAGSQPLLRVTLDPRTTDIAGLGPFIAHKTTQRAHYLAARKRGGAAGRDEVLLFSRAQPPSVTGPDTPASPDACDLAPRPDDLLTEGSYTNVAVRRGEQWVTPAMHCLPGIERAQLLEAGKIVAGDVRRDELLAGDKILMFNSVRGCFEGEIA